MINENLIVKLTDLLVNLHEDKEDGVIVFIVVRAVDADMVQEVIDYIEENNPTEDEFNEWAFGSDGTDGNIPPIEDEGDEDYEE